jgi:hypothetical protein
MIMSVVSNKVWSPQKFVEEITGFCYSFGGDDDVGRIAGLLDEHGYGDLWDYPLNEIDHIVECNHNVVLVDCLVWFENKNHYEHEYRWWQVPEDKIEAFKNKEEEVD